MDTLLSKMKLNTILHNLTRFKLFQKSTVVILKTQIRINEKNMCQFYEFAYINSRVESRMA
jgi:hypothetical protein